MSKKNWLLALVIFIGVLIYLTWNWSKEIVGTVSESNAKKQKVIDFIKGTVFENVNIADKAEGEYDNLAADAIHYFMHLKSGVELFNHRKVVKAWKEWSFCLAHHQFENFKAETYYIIGTALGETDGFTSRLLLHKALELARLDAHKNKALEYSCLNALVRLMAMQAEDDEIIQDNDIKCRQYSLDAYYLLKNNADYITERSASSSVFRWATESLYWLREDSLADTYIEYLLEQKQYYSEPELSNAYVNILHGVRAYIYDELNASENYFFNAIDEIGESTSYLNYDLELPYAYLSAIYVKQQRYSEAKDYIERSIKTLQSEHYTHIADPIKFIEPNKTLGNNNTYNIVMCYLRLQYYIKKSIVSGEETIGLNQALKLIEYTNKLIKYWFFNAADEETLLRATKLIKRSNSNAIDLLWLYQSEFSDVEERVYKLQNEASAFYFNYLLEIRNKSNNEIYERIKELTLELSGNSELPQQLDDNNIIKQLELLEYKTILWAEKSNALRSSSYKQCIPQNIDANSAVVKYFMSLEDLYVSYFTKDGGGWIKLKRQNFSSELRKLKRDVKSMSGNEEHLRFFYDLLIKPIKKQLRGVEEITILSDEKLAGVPFELLQDETGEYLIDQFTIKYAYSSRKSVGPRTSQLTNLFALAPGFTNNNLCTSAGLTRDVIDAYSFLEEGNRDDLKLAPIPFSTDEVKEIGQLFSYKALNSLVLTDKEAIIDKLKNHLSGTGIIHIATHGISHDKYQSGLFFTANASDDGFLSLKEIYMLDVNADLVVLSACKSGTGKVLEGEGVMALPRGFIYAGASNVIASLWKVHDEKTKELMVAFYKHLLNEQVTYARALQLAKQDCIKKGFLPVDWAGFVLLEN
ncbi:MAG: CHAT domain-containing protein [Carboxylicivirga sp.]|jgi:CHAT domain-containing protein|nr:CHAT domain-containing protein [Carboxylicivirga sp.]